MLRDSLSKLFYSVVTEPSFEGSLSIAGNLIEQGIDMPETLENTLIDFLTNKDKDSFVDLSREVLARNLLDDYVDNIKLISFLAKKKWLPLRDVALLLRAIPYTEREKLIPSYQKLIEVAELVCEDLSNGFMEVDDDDLLQKTLNDL
ncbi:MAG: hypothetical protein RRB22_13475 [Gammaproteobacteria bacterium]|nr:hypothetical protein [Gammaproteobacteria bacterium]